MKWLFPVRKTFHQDFLNKKWDKIFTVKYEQATIWEYYEYIGKTPDDQNKELYDILQKCVKYSYKDQILRRIIRNYTTKVERWLNIDEILTSIFQNRYRWYTSIFTEVKKKISIDWPKWKWAIDSVWLSIICTTYNISPTDLMKNYTLEQYFWFLDGVEWINNSHDKKWQAINDMAIIDKEAVKSRAEETRAKFKKFNK